MRADIQETLEDHILRTLPVTRKMYMRVEDVTAGVQDYLNMCVHNEFVRRYNEGDPRATW